ncbi:MAG TPA: amidase [Actinomycetota bacterium]|nr:amidase [Actinomycetota bacterium]
MRTLAENAVLVQSGQASPQELLEESLEAISRVQPTLNPFTCVMDEQARERAARRPPGPLSGVPVAVKDLFDIRGLPTTGCCAAYQGRVGAADSAVVERLTEAGAVVVAKTNQHELAVGGTNSASSFGPAWNPWAPGRSPGGSSGGSAAAVSSGAVPVAIGSDTLGSIRIPASFCGLTGLKPTHGAVSMRGAMPYAPPLDTAGPLARTAEDCLTVHRILAGFDPDDLWSRQDPSLPPEPQPMMGTKVGILTGYLSPAHPDTRSAVEAAARAMEDMGARVDEMDGPDPDEAREAVAAIAAAHLAHHHGHLSESADVGSDVSRVLEIGQGVSGRDYAGHVQTRRRVARAFEWLLTLCDVLISPATPMPAVPMDPLDRDVERGAVNEVGAGIARCTMPVNLVGLPAVAFPVGFTAGGLPVGAQLIGREWSEEVLLSVVSQYQQATDWHLREPPDAHGQAR